MIAPTARIMMPMLMLLFVAFATAEFRTGVGVKVFKLPAGRGVLVAGAGVGEKVSVGEASDVSDNTPVDVGVGV